MEQNNSPQESTRVERNQNLIHPENSKILEKKSKQHTKKLKASTLTENDVHNSDRHFVEPLINKCQRSDRSSKVHKQVAISKAYYPKIVNSVSSFFDVNESRSHLDLLDHFFQDICKVESLGLQLYSTQNPGREAIISVLIEFLAKLPEAVNRKLTMICDEDQVFHPELTQTEKEEQRILQTQLEILKKKSLLLDSYENNIKQFGIDYNLWIDEDISNEYIGLSREDVNVPQQQVLILY